MSWYEPSYNGADSIGYEWYKEQKKGKEKMTQHSELVEQCKQWLIHHGCVMVQTHSSYRKPAECGIPDLMGATADGLCIVVECESETGTISDKQKTLHYRFREKSAIVLVPRSIEDLESQYAEIPWKWDEK